MSTLTNIKRNYSELISCFLCFLYRVNLTGTAVRGSDYVVLVSKNVQVVETVTSYSLEVTFPAGDTSQQEINFFIINDVDVEPGSRETIVLTIIENATAFNNDNYTYSKVFIADNDG